MVVLLLGFYLLSACIDSYASEHNKMRSFKLFLIPILISILSFYKIYNIFLFLALFLCWIGDIYLIEKTKNNVQYGTIAFLIAHIVYCIDFRHIPSFDNIFLWIGLVIYILCYFIFLKTVFKDVEKQNKKATAIYMIVLFLMSFMAYSKMIKTGDFLTWTGSLFFVVSDILICKQFSTHVPQVGVMETYSVAQLLIVLGAIYATTL